MTFKSTNKKEKVRNLLIFLLSLFKNSSSLAIENKYFPSNSSLSVSKAISDVIREFYITNKVDFNLIIYGETTNHINDVINEVTKKLSQKENSINIKHFPFINYWNHNLNQSAVIFIKSMRNLENLHLRSISKRADYSHLTNSFSENLKFLVYIEEIKTFQQLDFVVKNSCNPAKNVNTDLRYFEFFITTDLNFVNFSANLLYSEKACEKFSPKILNSFDKRLQKWSKKLENFDHYRNFNGCLLKFRAELNNLLYFKKHKMLGFLSSLSKDRFQNFVTSEKPKLNGLVNEIVELMAKSSNFTPHFTVFLPDLDERPPIFISLSNYKTSLDLSQILLYGNIQNNSDMFQTFRPFTTEEYYFLLSHNDLYSNYEKLLFPFDFLTWVFLLFTFGLTFGTIFILHYCPKLFKTIIFGKGINKPAYNALGIFFGISQLRLPKESFCRVILIIYIWFCLIIRTCWQSKMFEFMTSDMRKPLPASIEDIRKMNYIYVVPTNRFNFFMEMLNNKVNSHLLIVDLYSMRLYYSNAFEKDQKNKYAFIITKSTHDFWISELKGSLPILPIEKFTKDMSIFTMKNSILFVQMNQIMNKFIETGIAQHLLDYAVWFLWRPSDKKVEDPRKVLSMSDLEFGFVIFLGFLSLPVVVFICELLSLKVRRQMRKLVGLYEFMRIIRERLKDYHDKW
ncbi:hypothetical protein PVAND_001475 [Polypedilum vanderplanki]|uniref:Ionotropic receptor n=1 Tax=Polypedilum vanderplanki TaxID=319348 RepID=A0A9J6BNJ5_POLVA|nr:hypothetical protein PVAND_001475 [Polypedilum vanderplanki]